MIRPLSPADEPAVRRLQSILEYADRTLVDAALSGPFVGHVAVADDAVVGYAIALPGREATLSELVVDPEYRREGYGRRLLEATSAATGAEEIFLTTPADERAAVSFYRAVGFSDDAVLEGFYGDQDGLRLRRRE